MSIEDLSGTIVRKICTACSREFAGSGGTCPHDGNILIALPQDPFVGKQIADKYLVLSILGTGGMGIVYLARHETMQCNVAIKMMRAQFTGDTASVKRFTREAIATRRLNHPHVITTYDHGFTPQGQPYIVMDCLDGKSLADEIKRLKQLSVGRAVHIFSQACDALDHAHKQGIIHRDLKPGNIMLINYDDDPDFVKVVDFGVAKLMPVTSGLEAQTLTQAGEVCGSPVYMSPEQCLGQDLDRRADIYSMGVVIYETLTGKMPLLGKNMVETMSKHINESPPSFKEARPDLYIPEKLEQVVMRALSKDPNNRPQSMAALRQEINFAVPSPGQTPTLRSIAISNSSFDQDPNKKPSQVLPSIAAILALLVIAGAIMFYFVQRYAPGAVPGAVSKPVGSTTGTVPAGGSPASNPASTSPSSATPSTPAPVSTGTSPGTSQTGSQPAFTQTGAAGVQSRETTDTNLTHKTVPPPKVVRRTATAKKPARGASPLRTHHAAAATAPKPKAATSADPFAALSKERTYKVNY